LVLILDAIRRIKDVVDEIRGLKDEEEDAPPVVSIHTDGVTSRWRCL
jgi:hypothetical protein